MSSVVFLVYRQVLGGCRVIQGVYPNMRSAVFSITLGDRNDFDVYCNGLIYINKTTKDLFEIDSMTCCDFEEVGK